MAAPLARREDAEVRMFLFGDSLAAAVGGAHRGTPGERTAWTLRAVEVSTV
jgi:hypothetical protein